jgi:hypothetical protein
MQHMKLTLTQAKLLAHKAVAEKLRQEEEERQRRREVERQQLRADLTEQFKQGKGLEAIDAMMGIFDVLEKENKELAEKLKAKLIALFGRQAERLTKEALGQLVAPVFWCKSFSAKRGFSSASQS